MNGPDSLPGGTLRERGLGTSAPPRGAAPLEVRPPPLYLRLQSLLQASWSSSDFEGEDLTRFAKPVMRVEAQQGVFVLGAFTMLLMAGLALLYYFLDLGAQYIYTFSMLSVLAGHIGLSARMVAEVKVLHLLGMVLLAGCGLAFMLLAHRYGVFTTTLFSTVVLLFMVVPLVPWGLREALLASGIVYLIFTASTLSATRAFNLETVLTLQFLMLTGAMIALAVVARAVLVRKGHVEARFKLTSVNAELFRLSHRDALTGAWNRRYLEENFGGIAARHAALGNGLYFAVLDIDKFKQLNDTYGHLCGDRALQRLVVVLGGALGPDDLVVRIGGDEFAVMLSGEGARARLEGALSAFGVRDETCAELPLLPLVSAGLFRLPAGGAASLEDSYVKADQALYEAKKDPAHRVVEALPQGQART